jgi:hypothetical protein
MTLVSVTFSESVSAFVGYAATDAASTDRIQRMLHPASVDVRLEELWKRKEPKKKSRCSSILMQERMQMHSVFAEEIFRSMAPGVVRDADGIRGDAPGTKRQAHAGLFLGIDLLRWRKPARSISSFPESRRRARSACLRLR